MRPSDELSATRASRRQVATVWHLIAVLAATAVLLNIGIVRGLREIDAPIDVPWWLLAIGFYLTEAHVVHFHLRREAHSFSLSEIPLVLGLFFADPSGLVLAHVVGAAAGLVFHRRQPATKVVFNLAMFALQASLALVVFYSIGDLAAPNGPTGWAAAFFASLVAAAVGTAAIFLAISLSGGVPAFRQEIGLAALATTANTCLALAAVATAWSNPAAAWLLIIPAGTLLLAYRAYLSQREKHDSLEFLYEASQVLHQVPDAERALADLLLQTRETFRTELAEVTLLASTESDPVLRTSVHATGSSASMTTVEPSLMEQQFMKAVGVGQSVLVRTGAEPTPLGTWLTHRRLRNAMVAPLCGETRVLGALVLANRIGAVNDFDEDDLRLFQTLANQVSVSLEKGRLGHSLSQLHDLQERLRHQAYHDSLTGLANRALLTDRVEQALAGRRPAQRPIGVLFVDLDDFKIVNDTLGHQAGDRLLIEVAQRLRDCVRPSDTAARLGGDEFAVLLTEVSEPSATIDVARRIIEAMERPFPLQNKDVSISASIGIALSGRESRDPGELMRNADVAMYQAKHSGKGSYAVFEGAMHQAIIERIELRDELQVAIKEQDLVVHYQPFVDLDSGDVVGLEALVRWEHPTRGLLPPDAFIGLAETTGLIRPLGELVLRQACRDIGDFRRRHAGHERLKVSVNLSAKQVLDQDVVESLTHILEETSTADETVILEITESVLMHDTAATLDKLERLRGAGFSLAMDDFGTGYSSLHQLRRLPIDILKIAKPFIDSLDDASDDAAFAQAIIQLGNSLDLDIIAEGVEHRAQKDRLRGLHCHLGQGFYFARPTDASGVDSLLARSTRSSEQ